MKTLGPRQGKLPLSLLAVFVATIGISNVAYGQFASAALDDGAFVYWTMNETGPGATSSIGTNPVNGNFPDSGQLEFGVPGLADTNTTAVRYNGFNEETGLGSIFNINNSGDINGGGPWLQKTVELWFSVDDANTSTEQVIYEQGGSTRGINVYVRDGKVFAGAVNGGPNDGGNVASPWPAGDINAGTEELAFVSTDIESNTPYHLALVMDGDDAFDEDLVLDGTIKGYLNGQEFGSVGQVGTLFAHTDAVRVGGVGSQAHFDPDFSGVNAYGNDGLELDPPAATARSPYHFRGVVDDLALYNTALTAEQVKAHYDAREYVAGDFDGNGKVEFADFTIFSANFNTAGSYAQGDMSFNGQIDIEDFSKFRRAFIAGNSPAGAAQVPEPSASWLILMAALALPALRRPRTRLK